MTDTHLRQAVIDTCLAMNASGINKGTSGNISVRTGDDCFLITPSGIAYDSMAPEQIVETMVDGTHEGDWKPSSEWRMHADIYRARPQAQAVLHCHAPHATAISCHRMDVPAFHYMIGVTGAPIIRCSDYALFGTQALSDTMVEALGTGNTCLLANHGMICFAKDLPSVLKLAIEVENLCEQFVLTKSLGEPTILTEQEMAEALAAFADYGKQPTKG